MEKQDSAAFVQWLAKQLGATSEEDLKQKASKLGEAKIKEMYAKFQGQPSMKNGGQFAYIECLKKLKAGGIVDCGCGGKMKKKVAKAQLGLAINAMKGVKGIMPAMKAGVKAAGGLQQVIPAIGGAVNTIASTLQPKTMAPTNVGINPAVNPMYNPTTKTNTPILNQQSIPSFTQVAEDGAKLSKVKKLRKFKLEGPGATMAKMADGGSLDGLSFGKAFSQSRASGAKEFTWKGKKFNTRTKEDEDKSSGKVLTDAASRIKAKTAEIDKKTTATPAKETPSREKMVIGRQLTPKATPEKKAEAPVKKETPATLKMIEPGKPGKQGNPAVKYR